MICIPVDADQPLVGYRVADELGLGVRLDRYQMTSNDVRSAIHKVLNDRSYYERADRFSQLSRKSIGYRNGAKLINEFLLKNNSV